MNFQVLKNFTVNTPQGERILQAGQIISLLKDKAKPLVEQNKLKALQSLTWETLARIHIGTGKELAREGLNLRLQTPEIGAIENSLNETWLDCLHGQATLDDFRAVNQQWATAIKIANEKAKKVGLL